MPDPIGQPAYPAAPQSPNLMGMVGQYAYAQNALNQNLLFQQEYKARQALGPVIQSAIDPKTGEFDVGKFLAAGAANPDVAWKMPEITNQMIQRQLTEAQIVNTQVDIQQKRFNNIGAIAGSLVAQADTDAKKMIPMGGQPVQPQISQDRLIAALNQDVAMGQFTGKEVTGFLKNMPQEPTQIYKVAMHVADASTGASKVLDSVRQSLVSYNQGGQTLVGQPNIRSGGITPVATLSQQPTVAEMASRVPSVTPTGAGQTTPAGQIPGALPTLGPLLQPATGAPQAPQPGQSPQPIGAGAPKPAGAGAEIPTKPTGAGAPTGAVQTSLGPVQSKALESVNDMRKAINSRADVAVSMNQIMDEMEQAAKSFKSGGGMSEYVKIAQAMQALGVSDPAVDKVAAGNLPAAQEFGKLQLQLSTAMLRRQMLSQGEGEGSAGRLTNLEFGAFRENNPNYDLDPRTLPKLFGFMRKINGIDFSRQQLFNKVYDNWNTTGSTGHPAMSDPSQFDPWFNKMLADRGYVGMNTAKGLGVPVAGPK